MSLTNRYIIGLSINSKPSDLEIQKGALKLSGKFTVILSLEGYEIFT